MFDALSNRLTDVFDRLKKRGALSESDVDAAMRDIRVALLEADVALSVVKEFIEAVRARAVGEEVVRSVTPGQMVVKIVNDHLTEMLGGGAVELNLAATPPAAIMMVGLQGSGKTTSTAKIAVHLRDALARVASSFSTTRYRAMCASCCSLWSTKCPSRRKSAKGMC